MVLYLKICEDKMDLENNNINALRILAVDMIENAKSGHSGIALGSAPILYTLYS